VGPSEKTVPGVLRRRGAGRWRLALFVSLALHGAAVLAVAALPGRLPRPHRPAVGAPVERLPTENGSDCVTFLVRRAAPRRGSAAAPIILVPEAPAATQPTPPVPLAHPHAPSRGTPQTAAALGSATVPQAGTAPGKGGTTFFQIATQAESVVYVIDRSASMGLGGALDLARRELLASLERLPSSARFHVLVYNSTATPLLPGWLQATPENKLRVASALRDLRAEGGTRHDQALPRALSMQPDVIFFLTDADDLAEADLRDFTRRNHGRSTIHVVELNTANRGRPDMPLQLLARQNGGTYQAVDPAQ
jgi:hypothetical protein